MWEESSRSRWNIKFFGTSKETTHFIQISCCYSSFVWGINRDLKEWRDTNCCSTRSCEIGVLLSSLRSHGEEERSRWIVKCNWQVVLSAQATLKGGDRFVPHATTLFRH